MSGALVMRGGEVLLAGSEVRVLAGLAAAGLAARRRDGWVPSAAERDLVERLAEASAMSRPGHGDVPAPAASGSLRRRAAVSTAEAARLLGISPRQVRRLSEDLGGRYTASGQLEFSLDAVTLAAEHRRKDKQS